jgi:murein DD-endopeptidase MepM/ murein hydrolase activator NlpD
MISNFKKIYFAHRSWIITGILWSLPCVLSVMLVWEYKHFHVLVKEFSVLRNDYNSYLVAVKKTLDDGGGTDEEPFANLRGNCKVVSSQQESEESFDVVNRSTKYLKDCAYTFASKQKKSVAFWQHVIDLYDNGKKVQKNTKLKKRAIKHVRKRRARSIRLSEKKPVSYANLCCQQAIQKPVPKEALFDLPISRDQFWLSSPYGPRRNYGRWGFHYGIDMAAVRGVPVKAAGNGIVIEAKNSGYNGGYGKVVMIAHNGKFRTRYAHLDRVLVKVGQKVSAGMLIGKVGATGAVRARHGDGSHLHFEVIVFGKRLNPFYYLR